MANAIIGLKYQSLLKKIETEEQLLTIFSELKNTFERLKIDFKIINKSNIPIIDLYEFLQIITEEKPVVTLEGSGYIEGITIKEGRIEYDLSEISELTQYWDLYRDGSCLNGCLNLGRYQIAQDYGEWYCTKGINPKRNNCNLHEPIIKNSEGKPARTLNELILVACA